MLASETSTLEQRVAARGVSAFELLALRGNRDLSPADLEEWMTGSGFAELDDVHLLRPTALAYSLAGCFEFLNLERSRSDLYASKVA